VPGHDEPFIPCLYRVCVCPLVVGGAQPHAVARTVDMFVHDRTGSAVVVVAYRSRYATPFASSVAAVLDRGPGRIWDPAHALVTRAHVDVRSVKADPRPPGPVEFQIVGFDVTARYPQHALLLAALRVQHHQGLRGSGDPA
jgi:hypothetical protein